MDKEKNPPITQYYFFRMKIRKNSNCCHTTPIIIVLLPRVWSGILLACIRTFHGIL